MGKRSGVVVGVSCAAVVVALGILASPLIADIGSATAHLADATSSDREDADLAEASGLARKIKDIDERTDYSTWTDEELAAARADDAFPVVINHPARFADGCRQNSMMTASGALVGAQTLIDMGPRQFAEGTVTRDADGRLATYTVAPGDAGPAIGTRFCVDYITVLQYNGVYPWPHPGDILRLHP